MLFEIQPAVTASNAVIVLHSREILLVARMPLSVGQAIEIGDSLVTVSQSIPAGHKVASRAISGEPVYRYGEIIGFAKRAIASGEHVHTHNLAFTELDHHNIQPEPRTSRKLEQSTTASWVCAFRRRNGIENDIAVVAASNCAAYTSELIAQSFLDENLPDGIDGVVAFPHGKAARWQSVPIRHSCSALSKGCWRIRMFQRQ